MIFNWLVAAFENEGTVEICFNNVWGLIGGDGWDGDDAKVVCRKLGYAAESKLNTCILYS